MKQGALDLPTTTTFVVYLVVMMALGIVAYRRTRGLSDYLLGGRQLGSGVAALSAGASDMSGWLLLALPGAVYASGLNQIWLAIGLAVGAYLNWQLIARRLRVYTEYAGDAITLPDYLAHRFDDRDRVLRVMAAAVILVFFAFYTASGLVAGAKLLETSFGIDYTAALLSGSVVIIAYTFLGGFLAVSWTDFLQGILMFGALIGLPIAAFNALGGWSTGVAAVGAIDPDYNDALAGMGVIGIASLLGWGLGYFGQPHILVRFMALRSQAQVPRARLIAIVWLIVGLFGAVFTGYAGVAYLDAHPSLVGEDFDGEKVFLVLTTALATPWLAGVLLAAVLAAVMSTIDSQLLVASSALAEDIYKPFVRPGASARELVWVGRAAVMGVAAVALVVASNPDSGVLALVEYAWGGFGAAFGPVILLSLFWRRMTRNGALAAMLVGAATVVIWRPLSGGIFELYELLPGFVLASLAAVVVSQWGTPQPAVQAAFDEVTARLR
jgi:sodium/proline symporter